MAKAWNQVFSFIQNNVCAFYVVFKLFCILLLVLLKVLRANGSFTLPTFSDFSNWFSGPNQTNKQTDRQSHNSQPTIQKRKYLPLCTEIKPRQQLNGSQERFAINFWDSPILAQTQYKCADGPLRKLSGVSVCCFPVRRSLQRLTWQPDSVSSACKLHQQDAC